MELKEKQEASPTRSSEVAVDIEEFKAALRVPIKGRRRNLGRQARKRRKKYLEIEAAASAYLTSAAASVETNANESLAATGTTSENSIGKHKDVVGLGTSSTISSTSILPTDRGYVLDDVRMQAAISDSDRHDLIRQLGYLPGNVLRVVARVEDAFTADDLQRLFADTAIVKSREKKKLTTATRDEFTAADPNADDTSENSDLRNGSYNCSITAKRRDREVNESRTQTIASMVQTMMKEPLVIKLYPLVLRDESSSTKRRRKRCREENKDDFIDHDDTNMNGTTTAVKVSDRKSDSMDTTTKSTTDAEATPLMEPFPTIYWVTHPYFRALISKLELDRLNVKFEQRLLNEEIQQKNSREKTTMGCNKIEKTFCKSSSPLASMRCAHQSYGKERRGLLSSRDVEYVKDRRWYDENSTPSNVKNATVPFSDGCGVAGIRNPKAVKCLHAHAAHYWSGNSDNIVGRWVWEQLKSGIYNTENKCVQCTA